MTGGGHQSSHDGFREDTVEGMKEWAKEYCDDYHTNISLEFWPSQPTQAILDKKIENSRSQITSLKSQIKSLKATIVRLSEMKGLNDIVQDGFDPELAEAFNNKTCVDVLKNLHKAGLVITYDQLSKMRRDWSKMGGSLSFTRQHRAKALRAIAKAKSYS